jgi:hypothetical protein
MGTACTRSETADHTHVVNPYRLRLIQRFLSPRRGLHNLISNRELDYWKQRALAEQPDRVGL